MKRLILIGLALLMLLSASCGSADPVESLAQTEAETEAATDDSAEQDNDPAANDATLSLLKVDGISVFGFSPEKTSYSVSAKKVDKMTIGAVATQEGATVKIEQSGSVATVTVTSPNGRKEKVYTLQAYERVSSKIVNKNGANAIVTYVIDDGDKDTATFVTEEMSPKYSSLNASFALVTKKLGTFKTQEGADGMLEYVKDSQGYYLYSKNSSEFNFWKTLLAEYADEGFEAVSHSHTHKYWGETDEGGSFEYKLNGGVTMTSEEFPRGNVSMEFWGSKQIIEDLGQRSLVFVRPGLNVNGKMVSYSKDFWTKMQDSGAYIGARGTYTYPDKPETMINTFSSFSNEDDRYFLKSYMVQHYNTSATTATAKGTSTPKECLDAGIDYWTTYIDTAVENNAWAAFCIHTIRPDNYVGSSHYIFESQADALFAYTEQLTKENKVWVANLTDAYLYVIERATSTVEAYVDENGDLSVALSCSETDDIYNMPLTVKVCLPEGKTGAALDGQELTTVTENGDVYVYVDVAPGSRVTLKTK